MKLKVLVERAAEDELIHAIKFGTKHVDELRSAGFKNISIERDERYWFIELGTNERGAIYGKVELYGDNYGEPFFKSDIYPIVEEKNDFRHLKQMIQKAIEKE